jgi:hypothetical protein
MTYPLDIAFIGHCTKDEITIKGATSALPGGGVYFGALSAAWAHKRFSTLPPRFLVITIGNPSDFDRINSEFSSAGLSLTLLNDSNTTTFLHSFAEDKPDRRISSVGEIGRPFELADVSNVRARIFYLNPLFYGEIDPALFPRLKEQCEFLFLDSQGLIRRQRGKLIFHECPTDLGAVLSAVDIFKVDAEEAGSLTGIRGDTEAACAALVGLGLRYLICTQQEGVAVYFGGERFWGPFTKWSLEGRTGRGDTVSAAFLVLHFVLGKGIEEAIVIAAKGCSNKMMHAGAAVENDFAEV